MHKIRIFYLSTTYGCHALEYFYMTDFVFNVNLIIKKSFKLLIIMLSLYSGTAKDMYLTLSENIIISFQDFCVKNSYYNFWFEL